MGNESNNSSADTTNSTANAITVSVAAASTTASNIETNYTISEGNHSCSKSISELLLGMVNATMVSAYSFFFPLPFFFQNADFRYCLNFYEIFIFYIYNFYIFFRKMML